MLGVIENQILQFVPGIMPQQKRLFLLPTLCFAPLKADFNPTQIIPVLFSANPNSICSLAQRNTVCANLALPWQYFNVISA
ncbi:hypothetical protein RintRC_4729 [Richelia intracellularis]|nr:hypothetical protein RintRC_4729 [Richelia intracellularis]